MAGSDYASWKRQNSDTVLVEVQMNDGTMLKGTILVQRERGLKDVFNSSEPFLDFECGVSGPMILCKTSVRMVRPYRQQKADQLADKLKMLEKSEAHAVLKVAKTADRTTIRNAYLSLARSYHPDRYSGIDLPPEMLDYLNAMTRRINAAYSELVLLLGPEGFTAAA